MDGSTVAARSVDRRDHDSMLHGIGVATFSATMGVVFLLSLLLIVRRFTVTAYQPLGAYPLVMVGLVTASAVLMLHSMTSALAGAGNRLFFCGAHAVSSSVLMLIGISVTLPDSDPVALVAFWSVLGMEELGWWGWAAYRAGRTRVSVSALVQESPRPGPATSDVERVAMAEALRGIEELPADEVWQQMTRLRHDDGSELLVGFVRAEFMPDERSQNVHLAFCPPLESRPQFECEPIEGPPVRIKVAQVEPFGVRLELRLSSRQSEPAVVLIEFHATASESGTTKGVPM